MQSAVHRSAAAGPAGPGTAAGPLDKGVTVHALKLLCMQRALTEQLQRAIDDSLLADPHTRV